MKESNSRREFLSQSGKMVTAAALFGTSVPLAHAAVAGTLNCEANNTMKITDPHYYLDNVLLETGFDYENGVAVQTRTARQTVEIQDGKIVALRENKQHPDATLPHYDAGGKLMLPTTRDMHIHLDKTFYGGPWRSLNRPICQCLMKSYQRQIFRQSRIWGWYRCLWISLWEQAPWAGHIHLRQTLCRYWTGKPNLQ